MASLVQFRRDTNANWTTQNPVLAQGELALDLNNNNFKIGDGIQTWSELPASSVAALHANLTDLATSGHPASIITNEPAGNLVATTVQEAIDELDSEKEVADATILKESDLSVTVQEYNSGTLISDPSGVTGADVTTNVMSLTQAEYDAIPEPVISALYVITD